MGLQMCNSCLKYKELNNEGVCQDCYLETLKYNLYIATDCCKDGNCNNCPRRGENFSSSTFTCKSNLIKDCHEFLSEII